MHESVGMREPKAHLSELVRAAANGELIVLTDYGKPLAVITSIEGEGANRADDSADASKFRQALLALPHHLDVNFELDQHQTREASVTSWLIDAALFKSLAPGQRRTDSFRPWIETHEDPLFLSAASIVEIKAAIRIPASQAIRADAG